MKALSDDESADLKVRYEKRKSLKHYFIFKIDKLIFPRLWY